MKNKTKIETNYYLLLKDLKERYPDFQDLLKKEQIKWELTRAQNLNRSQIIQIYKEVLHREMTLEDKKLFTANVLADFYTEELKPYLDTLETDIDKNVDLLSITHSLASHWGLDFDELSSQMAEYYLLKIKQG